MTFKESVIAFVESHPGLTAYIISKHVGIQSSTASSILHKAATKTGELYRTQTPKGAPWRYYPRGPAPEYPSRFERVLSLKVL